MNTKILIIGQAPPAVKQTLPYDTTMLYDWFNEIGVSKEIALQLFDFDAVYDKFPGFNSNGGHLTPSKEQMEDYWARELEDKVNNAKSILCLGACARDFLKTKEINKTIEYLIHPSKRNLHYYNTNKDFILNKLKKVVYGFE